MPVTVAPVSARLKDEREFTTLMNGAPEDGSLEDDYLDLTREEDEDRFAKDEDLKTGEPS